MNPVRFFRARLSRVIFAWLAFVILATTIVITILASTFWVVRGQDNWQAQTDRVEAYVGSELARVWDDDAELEREVTAMGENIGIRVEVRDLEGNERVVAGPACADRPAMELAVRQRGEKVGTATVCDPSWRQRRPFLGTLLFILLVLWIASAIVARRIVRPLDDLTDKAKAFGQGNLEARVEVANDRTELGELGATFNDMADRIERQIEDQKALLAEVSHEMRTPLGHQRIMLEMLRDEMPHSKHVDGLAQELDAMDQLVEQLLAKSRLGFQLARAEELDPADLAVAAMERVGVDVSLLEVDEVPTVRGDASLLGFALTNLLRNAQTHGGGATRVHVSAAGGNVSFVVEDDGPGLDEAARDKLFEPFVEGDIAGTGLGLGLALVGRIVHAHDGEVVTDRQAGRTVVGFTLPSN